MFDDFKKILEENYDITDVTLNTNFKKDLGLTSFDFINLLCLIEDKYNVELDDQDYRNVNTIKELIECIKKKRC